MKEEEESKMKRGVYKACGLVSHICVKLLS